MFKLRIWLAAMAAVVAGTASAAPLEVYGRLPTVEDVDISPDGQRLAVIWTNGEKRSIRIDNLAQHRLEIEMPAGDAKLRGVFWAGSDHLIVVRSTTSAVGGTTSERGELSLAFDYNLKTGSARTLLRDAGGGLNVLAGAPVLRTVDGKPVLFVQGYRLVNRYTVVSLFKIELDHDYSTLVEDGSPHTNRWVMGPGAEALGQSLWDSQTGQWTMKMKTGGFWHELRTAQAKSEPPFLRGLGRDGQSIIVSELHDGVMVDREVSADGKVSDPLPYRENDSAIYDPVRHNLIGFSALVGEEHRYNFFDPHDAAVWRSVVKAYPDQGVTLASWSADRRKIVVHVDSPQSGPGYALVDLDAHSAEWIANRYEHLTPADISPVRALRFKAQDGTALTGYLTVPRGREAKNLPLVVFPHGGPAARDTPGFDWWAQAMASRGYAVLQVNFRGSDGFGWDFLKAGFGEWGRKMQTDLSDGVRYLAGQGSIDPKRVCIVGASYGGYAAMAGPTLDPGVYRCAVAYAGISDMKSFTPWVREHNGEASQRYVLRFIGAEDGDPASLAAISPAAHVQKASVPMLLIHGKDDTVVPIYQSQAMLDAMKAAGKPVEMLTLDSTDHWLTRGDTRLAMLQATVAFLEKNNPPN